MNTLAERLKKIRNERGVSQAKLAKLTKQSQSAIAALESGRNQESTAIAKMAEVLGVSAIWLETGKGNVNTGIQNIGSTINGDQTNVQGDSYNLYQDTGTEPTQAELPEADAQYLKSMPLMDINLAARYLINPDKDREQIYDKAERAATFIPHSSETIGIRIADNSLIEFSADRIQAGDILIIEPKIPPRSNDLVFLCINNTGYWRGMICRLKINIDGSRSINHDGSSFIPMPQGALIGGVIVELKRRLIATELLESRLDPTYDIQQSIQE